MATRIIDNRRVGKKLFEELAEGEMFFFEDSNILKMKTHNVYDDDEEVIANTVDLDDGLTSYTSDSYFVIPVNVIITIE